MMYANFIALALMLTQAAAAAPKISFEEIRAMKPISSNSTQGPSQYLITSMWTSATCAGSLYEASAVGFGTCMGGQGYSMSYTNPTSDGSAVKYSMNYYSSNDCTGVPTTYPMTSSESCTSTGTWGLKYSLGSSWSGLGVGMVNQIFPVESVCTSGGSADTFSFTPLNSCIQITSNDNNAKSEMFTGCDSLLHYKQYTDAACQDLLQENSGALTHCYKSPDYAGVSSVTCAN
jgi:hypothetical protein